VREAIIVSIIGVGVPAKSTAGLTVVGLSHEEGGCGGVEQSGGGGGLGGKEPSTEKGDHIVNGGEEAGVSRDATHSKGVLIVDFTLELAVAVGAASLVLGGCTARPDCRVREEAGVLQTDLGVHLAGVSLKVALERAIVAVGASGHAVLAEFECGDEVILTDDLADDVHEGHEVLIAVFVGITGSVHGGLVHERLEALLTASEGLLREGLGGLRAAKDVSGVAWIRVDLKARVVKKQIADQDVVLAVSGKEGKITSDGGVNVKKTHLVESGNSGCGGQQLCAGSHIEKGVKSHIGDFGGSSWRRDAICILTESTTVVDILIIKNSSDDTRPGVLTNSTL